MCYYLQHTLFIVLIDAVIFTDALLLFKYLKLWQIGADWMTETLLTTSKNNTLTKTDISVNKIIIATIDWIQFVELNELLVWTERPNFSFYTVTVILYLFIYIIATCNLM